MTHEVVGRVEEPGGELAGLGDENESLGKLSERTLELLRSAGVIRLLQPKEFGGFGAQRRRPPFIDTAVNRPFVTADEGACRACGQTRVPFSGTGELTRKRFGRTPTRPGAMADLGQGHYFGV